MFRRMFRLQNRCPGCVFQKNVHVPVSMFQGVWDTPPPPPSYRGTGDIGGVRLLTMVTPMVDALGIIVISFVDLVCIMTAQEHRTLALRQKSKILIFGG